MTASRTRNLGLILSNGLTAEAISNLNTVDRLGSATYLTNTDSVEFRAIQDVTIQPGNTALGGSANQGSITFGSASNTVSVFKVHSSDFRLEGPLKLLDQSTGGTKYLLLKYASAVSGTVDSVSDRTLSLDMQGADRAVTLGADLKVSGAAANARVEISVTSVPATVITVPFVTDNMVGEAFAQPLTAKTFNADLNTLTNVRNANIASDASILRSKLAVGALGEVVFNDASTGALTSEARLNRSRGGTGIDSLAIFPVSGTIVTRDAVETLTNKTISGLSNTISNIPLGALPTLIPASQIGLGTVSTTEFDYLDGVTSPIQVQLNAKAGAGNYITALTGDVVANGPGSSASSIQPGVVTSIMLAGGISYSKLNLASAVVNADISPTAAIAGTKISPSFGAQNIVTQGSLFLSNGTFSVGFEIPALASTTLYTLPSTAGIPGQLLRTDGMGILSWVTAAGSGTVTSVQLSAPASLFSVSGGPITTTGTITVDLATQVANRVWAGPISGIDATPAFRVLVSDDVPTLGYAKLSLTGSIVDADIAPAAAIANSKLANMTAATFKGRASGSGTGAPVDLSATQATAALNVFTAGLQGLVPASGGGSTTFLRADGIFVATGTHFKSTWTTADGTSKVVTHSLGTVDVIVQVYEISTGETIAVDTVIRTNTNVVTLTASVAPPAGSWRVLIHGLP